MHSSSLYWLLFTCNMIKLHVLTLNLLLIFDELVGSMQDGIECLSNAATMQGSSPLSFHSLQLVESCVALKKLVLPVKSEPSTIIPIQAFNIQHPYTVCTIYYTFLSETTYINI